MLPNVRGVISTTDDAEVMLEMTGRTVFEGGVGHQLLCTLFESEHAPYTWLNDVVCVAQGRIEMGILESVIEVYVCEPS
jgi:hypothetical protein